VLLVLQKRPELSGWKCSVKRKQYINNARKNDGRLSGKAIRKKGKRKNY
jgi:hypothetical protein